MQGHQYRTCMQKRAFSHIQQSATGNEHHAALYIIIYTRSYIRGQDSSAPRQGLWGIPDYSVQSSVPSGDWPWALALGSVVRPQL